MTTDHDNVREKAKAALQKIRDNAAQGKVVFAPMDRLEELGPDHTQTVLDAIGEVMRINSNRIMVTDDSMILDFGANEEEAADIGKILGVGVNRDDYIREIVTRVRNKELD